jgi:hypothetical protein
VDISEVVVPAPAWKLKYTRKKSENYLVIEESIWDPENSRPFFLPL